MKITIYELLGMINDNKAPKKIKVTGTIYEYDEEYGFYFTKTKNGRVALGGKLNEINLIYNFNNENNVEIIEEDKKIFKMHKILPSPNYVIADKNVDIEDRLETIRKRLYDNELYMLDIANTTNALIDKLNEMENNK